MCLIFVGMDALTCCGLLLCCWLVCDRFLDLLLSFIGFLLWVSPSFVYLFFVREYLITHGSGIITMVAEAATNRVAPMLSFSDPSRRHCKIYLLPRKKFRYKF